MLRGAVRGTASLRNEVEGWLSGAGCVQWVVGVGMTTTVAILAAGAAIVAFALLAWFTVQSRNRADAHTRDALHRLSDGMESITHGIGAVVERAQQIDSTLVLPVTLDLDEGLRRVASLAAALPGMTAGAARVNRIDGTPAVAALGIVSGATGLEHPPEPPHGQPWRSAYVGWEYPAGASGGVQRGVIVPVFHERERIGYLGAYTTAGTVGPEVIDALVGLAQAAGPSLAAARTHESLKELVRTDPLTGMLNRRGLDDELAREIARATRTGSPLSVLMLDLDDFGALNKATSYAHGDELLREFGRVVREACREADIPCRRGGDEFLVILPDTQCRAALQFDARLRALLATTDFPHVDSLSYSSGLTTLRELDDADSLDRRASELVNRVKRSGPGRIAHDCDELLRNAG